MSPSSREMKPIDELTRAELADEFRVVLAEARRRGIKPDVGLISDWYALRQSQRAVWDEDNKGD